MMRAGVEMNEKTLNLNLKNDESERCVGFPIIFIILHRNGSMIEYKNKKILCYIFLEKLLILLCAYVNEMPRLKALQKHPSSDISI